MISRKKRPTGNFYMPYITIAFVIFSILTYVYWMLPIGISTRIAGYTQNMTLIIFTVTALVTLQTYKQQNDDRIRMAGVQYANLTQSGIGEIDKIFMSNPLLDRLYFQMYSHDPHIIKIVAMRGPIIETPEMLRSEHQISNLIFQKMADVFACEKLEDVTEDCIEWINTFRGWMKSPILRSHWQYLKFEQHPEVRNFVDKYLIKMNKFIKTEPNQKKISL